MSEDVEVSVTEEGGKAVIKGKTSVPFKTFVSLILQRKVQHLFKAMGNEPVIVGSELLTGLASAPPDQEDDRMKTVLVTLGVGVIFGIFLTLAALVLLAGLDVYPQTSQMIIVLAALFGVFLLVSLLQRMQGRSSTKEKVYEKMEKVTQLIMK